MNRKRQRGRVNSMLRFSFTNLRPKPHLTTGLIWHLAVWCSFIVKLLSVYFCFLPPKPFLTLLLELKRLLPLFEAWIFHWGTENRRQKGTAANRNLARSRMCMLTKQTQLFDRCEKAERRKIESTRSPTRQATEADRILPRWMGTDQSRSLKVALKQLLFSFSPVNFPSAYIKAVNDLWHPIELWNGGAATSVLILVTGFAFFSALHQRCGRPVHQTNKAKAGGGNGGRSGRVFQE